MKVQRILFNSAVIRSFVYLIIVSAVATGGISNILSGKVAFEIGAVVFGIALFGWFTFGKKMLEGDKVIHWIKYLSLYLDKVTEAFFFLLVAGFIFELLFLWILQKETVGTIIPDVPPVFFCFFFSSNPPTIYIFLHSVKKSH